MSKTDLQALLSLTGTTVQEREIRAAAEALISARRELGTILRRALGTEGLSLETELPTTGSLEARLIEAIGSSGKYADPESHEDVPEWVRRLTDPYVKPVGEDDFNATNRRRDREELERHRFEAEAQRAAQAERRREAREREQRDAERRAEERRREAEAEQERAERLRKAADTRDEHEEAKRTREIQEAESNALRQARTAQRILRAEEIRRNISEIARGVVERTDLRVYVETDGYRNLDPDSPWEPHERGAIDYRSKDIGSIERQAEAREISRLLGSDHVVIVEEVDGGKQTNYSYRGGTLVRPPYETARRASGTHTHVQPDRWWRDDD